MRLTPMKHRWHYDGKTGKVVCLRRRCDARRSPESIRRGCREKAMVCRQCDYSRTDGMCDACRVVRLNSQSTVPRLQSDPSGHETQEQTEAGIDAMIEYLDRTQ